MPLHTLKVYTKTGAKLRKHIRMCRPKKVLAMRQTITEGNFCEQHVTQSPNPLSVGQCCMHEARSAPSSPPVHELPHLASHSLTQIANTSELAVGQDETHAWRDPPGHPLGVGDGTGAGGTGAGGTGAGGVEMLPLFTSLSLVKLPKLDF